MKRFLTFANDLKELENYGVKIFDVEPFSRKTYAVDGTHYGFNFYRTIISAAIRQLS